MKVAVMGAGAVGGYYGGVLARDGVDVALICRGAQRDAIRSAGLRVDSHWGQFKVNPFATDDPGEVGPVDLVLHCVKLYSNDEAVPLLRPMVGDETNILTIQNGVTSGQRLADEFGWGKVLQGATYIEAAIAAPGHIEQTGSAARIEFGERDGTANDRAEAIKTLLDRPGIQVAVSSDIASTLWTKLVAVAAFGTVMTVSRASLPEVLGWPEGTATIRTVMEEIVAVGKARGIDFPPDVVDERFAAAAEEADEFRSSLQMDMRAGKPLEVDELLGAVVRMARDMGIPVPASSALVMALEPFKNGGEAGN